MTISQTEVNRLIAGRARLGELAALFSPGAEAPAPLSPRARKALRERLSAEVLAAEDVDWRGDAIEAEAFAFLAARTAAGLPISFPATTGAPEPMTRGRIVAPSAQGAGSSATETGE